MSSLLSISFALHIVFEIAKLTRRHVASNRVTSSLLHVQEVSSTGKLLGTN